MPVLTGCQEDESNCEDVFEIVEECTQFPLEGCKGDNIQDLGRKVSEFRLLFPSPSFLKTHILSGMRDEKRRRMRLSQRSRKVRQSAQRALLAQR
jgi:hypothetical protein